MSPPRPDRALVLDAARTAALAGPAWVVGGLIARRRLPRIAAAAGALAARDAFLPPRRLLAALALFTAWSALRPYDDPVYEGDRALRLYLATALTETAVAAARRRPRGALVRGGAMAAFAVPALLARRRRRRAIAVPVPAEAA